MSLHLLYDTTNLLTNVWLIHEENIWVEEEGGDYYVTVMISMAPHDRVSPYSCEGVLAFTTGPENGESLVIYYTRVFYTTLDISFMNSTNK